MARAKKKVFSREVEPLGRINLEVNEEQLDEEVKLDESPVVGGVFKVGDDYVNSQGEKLHVDSEGNVYDQPFDDSDNEDHSDDD